MMGAARHTDLDVDLLALSRRGPVHFMGVAGVGVSALAELVVRSGGRATGCDLRPGAVGGALRELGVEIRAGHDAAHVEGAVAVVTTAAVPADHAELEAARQAGIPVLKRAAALGSLVRAGELVAVAGTHGKTTTTAMTASILEAAGLDPTAFVGGRVPAWNSGLRYGGSDLFVAEADEFDRSFLALTPRVAVVTSVEADHLDSLGSLEALRDAFREFLARVPADGLVVACTDDEGVRAIVGELAVPVLGYGTDPGAELRAVGLNDAGTGTSFTVEEAGAELGRLELSVPGRHNVQNALAAFAAARHVGADMEAARRGLAAFRGVARRFEVLGTAAGVTVVDDYAHHPTEIRATLAAARGRYPGRRIVAVFQPHLYSRTRDLGDAFGKALADADAVWVTDIYPAREAPLPGVTGELVADAARRAGAEVRYHADAADVDRALAPTLAAGDVCVTLGAGDIDNAARGVLETLRGRGGAD